MSAWPIAIAALPLFALCILFWQLLSLLRAQAPRQVRQVCVGQGVPDPMQAIPRIIWAFWHDEHPPPFIQACLANWRRHAPDHELRLLSDASLGDWLDLSQQPVNLHALPAYRRADWLRIQLLARHGGIWMDASMLMTRSLDWLHQQQCRDKADYIGFYIQRFSTRADCPIVENWMMAAAPASAFAQALAQEFNHALALGEVGYLSTLQQQGQLPRLAQGMNEQDQRYLQMHVAAAVVLDRMPNTCRLSLQCAEDSAYAFHARLAWRKRHLLARLAWLPAPQREPAVIKFRGSDRRVIERGWHRGQVLRNSLLGRELGPAP